MRSYLPVYYPSNEDLGNAISEPVGFMGDASYLPDWLWNNTMAEPLGEV